MAQMGLLEETFRLPMVPPTSETRERLGHVLAEVGLLPVGAKR
jgi:dihydrodipicolinate synthase/N-acetylneuraminate lyase